MSCLFYLRLIRHEADTCCPFSAPSGVLLMNRNNVSRTLRCVLCAIVRIQADMFCFIVLPLWVWEPHFGAVRVCRFRSMLLLRIGEWYKRNALFWARNCLKLLFENAARLPAERDLSWRQVLSLLRHRLRQLAATGFAPHEASSELNEPNEYFSDFYLGNSCQIMCVMKCDDTATE